MLVWVTSVARGTIVATQESQVKSHEAGNEQEKMKIQLYTRECSLNNK